ncbi:MAG TPA: hypothetical protein VLZ28_01445 [Daejeonella sp.]|nr:hypothetical protein [Daejeonella sp.]
MNDCSKSTITTDLIKGTTLLKPPGTAFAAICTKDTQKLHNMLGM